MKLFVWDFHGVLERGNEQAVRHFSNKILESNGYEERFTQENINALYGRKWHEYFEQLLPAVSHTECVRLANECIATSTQEWDEVLKYLEANHHAHEVLSTIGQKHEQILISNTVKEKIGLFLAATDLGRHFTSENTFPVDSRGRGGAKAEILKAYLAGKNYEQIIIIGDSPTDIALKDVAGGVAYYYTHQGILPRSMNADHYINDLREVLKEA